MDTLRIGLVSVSDRASTGVYQDKGIPALEEWLASALTTPFTVETRLIPDEQPIIEQTLCELVDEMGCHLVLTTGGTGPARRDVTPDATLAVADRQMPGFGEQMRQISLNFVPTAILSRQVGVIRKQALILNLPGQPKSIKETLEGLRDESGKVTVAGIFASVPYCIQLLDGPYVETCADVVAAFRPKSAIRDTKP
ncbi:MULTISPECIES: molybdopterin adenylyltransferase [Atlantibacter]|uniref:Molybdopterin adenylyltransferase n=1 Tax=Atlantibacter hermannii NBRC 105704 TaxID=1115512 RepID=H5UZS1_ATLHE|nr:MULTISPECIES: molybdopterin adenylyltransferase [Atlantibacter]MCQ4966515.1 molybdopterin adenylyltransferase [Enterobacteriaceae bacterium DFI.7.85]HAP82379.1 molybdopterin adenylyltransferase [Enterobacteriaceae bacterium]KIU33245.1 molybdenum cofactor biosynthesis protein MogA [Atlantibacter hermannii]MBW9430006.1 molybdopterin adenylyltransferase [Atlantibacter hermannii]MDU7391844.1 molybdopterin adenylyltransferase [Atlantibacter hermannii]